MLKRTATIALRSLQASSSRTYAPPVAPNLPFSTNPLADIFKKNIGTVASFCRGTRLCPPQLASMAPIYSKRLITTMGNSSESVSYDASALPADAPPRLKFKRLDKTARHIMQILDKEAVEQLKTQREIPDIKPGYIVQLKLEVPENKRRVSIIKGIVIARRNAGVNTTFRLRRLVAGVGVESLLPLFIDNHHVYKMLQ